MHGDTGLIDSSSRRGALRSPRTTGVNVAELKLLVEDDELACTTGEKPTLLRGDPETQERSEAAFPPIVVLFSAPHLPTTTNDLQSHGRDQSSQSATGWSTGDSWSKNRLGGVGSMDR